MTAKMGIREGLVSAIVFSVILFALVSFDPRVKEQVSSTLRSGSVHSWTHSAGEVGSTLWRAAQDKSLDGGPVLIFATVGAVLTVFMLRS
jgi:hypothetical protein